MDESGTCARSGKKAEDGGKEDEEEKVILICQPVSERCLSVLNIDFHCHSCRTVILNSINICPSFNYISDMVSGKVSLMQDVSLISEQPSPFNR
jgi:hypothetical protein